MLELAAIMPLAAPIGSGLGNTKLELNIKIIRSQTKLPLIIDAGLGQASDATIAMELGCDGVLVNTAIAKAKKPFQMALAFKNSVIAGRQSYLSGRIEKYFYWEVLPLLKKVLFNFFFIEFFFIKFIFFNSFYFNYQLHYSSFFNSFRFLSFVKDSRFFLLFFLFYF